MGTCLASDNRVFLGADGIGIHHLKMYELLFTFGFISTTVNCNNKAEWKWLTSVKLSKCKCLLVWRHKSFLYYINHFDHWTGSWGVLQGCGWLLFSLHPSSALTETDRYATHLFRKAITLFFFFLLSIGSAESTFPRHGAGWLKSEQELYSEMAARMEKGHWFHWSCVKGIRKQANSRTWYCESKTGRV